MGDEQNERIEKIESFLNDQLSYKPKMESRDGKSYVWNSIDKIEQVVFGNPTTMGMQTKVRFMWWANYFIGAGIGSLLTIIFQKLVG